MKAIVVRQPWATLIALGVKVIETRPSPPNGPMRPEGVRGLPGCSLERGERIAIVAGAKPLRREAWLPNDLAAALVDAGLVWQGTLAAPNGRATRVSFKPDLPLGAVVCTVAVDDALPIVGEDGDLGLDVSCIEHRPKGTTNAGLWLWPRPDELTDDTNPPDLTDQLPLGDFTPGRWGWMLSDPQPPTRRCVVHKAATLDGKLSCFDCQGSGRVSCDPIPCKGRQGVFELPAEVAEALS